MQSEKATAVYCLLFALILSALTGCETVGKLTDGIEKPRPEVVKADLMGLSFESLAFLFDVKVANPDPIGIEMHGFDYEFLIEEATLVKGDSPEGNGTKRFATSDNPALSIRHRLTVACVE